MNFLAIRQNLTHRTQTRCSLYLSTHLPRCDRDDSNVSYPAREPSLNAVTVQISVANIFQSFPQVPQVAQQENPPWGDLSSQFGPKLITHSTTGVLSSFPSALMANVPVTRTDRKKICHTGIAKKRWNKLHELRKSINIPRASQSFEVSDSKSWVVYP